ncbi:hypothetical protein Tco_0884375 [Tanacetum coccineum]
MSNMSEDIQYAGSDTRPPMLDRTNFESWQQRIRPERVRVFTDLTAEEKERYKADIRATNILLQVQDREYDSDCEDKYHEVNEMQSDVQHNYVVDSDADYTSDSNIIPYDQYVEDNEEHVVQSNVSSIRKRSLMSILD